MQIHSLTYALAVSRAGNFRLVALAVVLQTTGPFAVATLGVQAERVLFSTDGTDFWSVETFSIQDGLDMTVIYGKK